MAPSTSTNIDIRHGTFGLAFIAVGAILLLAQWGLIPDVHPAQFIAPAILISIGLGRLAETRRPGRRGSGGWTLIVIGVWLLLANMHVWRLGHTWPLLLVAIGLGIVWKAVHGERGTEGVVR